MTKQTVYQISFAGKSGFYIAISEEVCLSNSPLLERSDELSNEIVAIRAALDPLDFFFRECPCKRLQSPSLVLVIPRNYKSM